MSKDTIISEFDRKLNPSIKFYDVDYTSGYSPIPYFAQTIAVAIGKIIKLSPIVILYLVRLFNLLLSTLITYYAIKILPFQKWTAFVIALMPMSVAIRASCSQDAFTNSIALLIFSKCLQLAYAKSISKVSNRDLIYLGLLTVALALSKTAYLLLPLCILLVPGNKFGLKYKKHAIVLGIILLPVLTLIIWQRITYNEHVSISSLTEVHSKDGSHLEYILNEPVEIIYKVIMTFKMLGKFYAESWVGILGWLDTRLPETAYIIVYLLLLFNLSLGDKINESEKTPLKMNDRLIMLSIFIVSVLIIIVGFYYTSNPINAIVIQEVQGRYFMPICLIPFIALTYFTQNKIHSKIFNIKSIITSVLVCYVLIQSYSTVIDRFYY